MLFKSLNFGFGTFLHLVYCGVLYSKCIFGLYSKIVDISDNYTKSDNVLFLSDMNQSGFAQGMQYLKDYTKAIAFFILTLSVGYNSFSQEVYLNEMVSNSDGFYIDEDGDSSDWVEIHNPSEEVISLLGYGLSDDPEDLFKWTFPDIAIDPMGYLVVFCSDKDRPTIPLHTSFKLKSSGELILLTHPDGEVLDQVNPTPLAEGFALAKVCSEICYWEKLPTATPGVSNMTGSIIAFSSPSGVFTTDLAVSINHSLGHDIRYTLDGSIPTMESPLYDGPISFTDATATEPQFSLINTSYYWDPPTGDVMQVNNIRAMSFVDEIPTSEVFSKTYAVGEEVSQLFEEYPVFSFQIDGDSLFDFERGIHVRGVHFDPSNSQWTGNFYQRGSEWERDVHMEYFENAVPVWSQEAGVRIHGGKTRNAPQKSFRLYARDELGAGEFHHPFFETKDKTVFDKLLLRCGFGCWNQTVIKDEVSAYVARDLDFDSQHSRPCIVFINGEYWGIFAIRDFYDSQYIEEEYGIENDSVTVMAHASGYRPNVPSDWGLYEGDNTHYIALMDFMENADMTVSSNYEYIKTQMDMSSMIDYYSTEIFFANRDWPAGNHKVWRGSGDAKWRWLLFDMDSGWGYQGPAAQALIKVTATNSSAYYNLPWATFLLRKFLESPVFVEEFKARYACLMKNEFEAETLQLAIDRFVDIYTPGMPQNIDRWHMNNSMSEWNSRVNSKLRDFADDRHNHAIDHIAEYFNVAYDIDEYDCDGVVTSTAEIEEPSALLIIYPNPSSDHIWIDSNDITAGYLRIFDSMGRLVHESNYQFHQRVDIGSLSQGVYIARLESGGKRFSRQFVKR